MLPSALLLYFLLSALVADGMNLLTTAERESEERTERERERDCIAFELCVAVEQPSRQKGTLLTVRPISCASVCAGLSPRVLAGMSLTVKKARSSLLEAMVPCRSLRCAREAALGFLSALLPDWWQRASLERLVIVARRVN